MTKPLPLYLFNFIERIIGKESFHANAARGTTFQFSLPSTRRLLHGNLRRILRHTQGTEPSVEEMDAIIREMASLSARNLIDWIGLYNSWPGALDPAEMIRDIKPDLLPVLKDLLRQGRGAVLVSAHFGNHLKLSSLACFGVPVTQVALDVESLRRFVPESIPLRVESLGGAASPCLKALRDNETVLVMGDMEILPGGRTADFFGAPVHPPSGAARLALAACAPILPIYDVYRDGFHHLECDEPILPDASSSQEDLEERILRSMERFIGRHPEHWLIMVDPWNIRWMDARCLLQLKMTRLRQGPLRPIFELLGSWSQ